MSGSAWQWPALRAREGSPIPDRLEARRAVWGKVHGAASDFRWIAASRDVKARAHRLEKELSLGFEDVPRAATCWRALRGTCYALSCYPSRATDASLRFGFLEKQLLEWSPEDGLPAALGALLLLPRAAAFDDTVWWDKSEDPRWSEAGFFLDLEDEPPVGIDGLDAAVERGRTALGERVDEESLARLYATLLEERHPAVLAGLEEPLPPEALAALLLPLPRRISDGLSIAGWPMSEHAAPGTFPQLWNVLVCDRIPSGFPDLPRPVLTSEGILRAKALLTGDPGRLGGAPVPAPAILYPNEPAPAGRSPEILERLRAFSRDESQRWLEPEELAGSTRPLRSMDDQAGPLADFVRTVDEAARQSGPEEKREQLEVKADLLRAVALALAPSSIRKVGLPKSRRVPALLFGPDLDSRDGEALIRKLDSETLEEAVRQSLSCKPDRYGGKIRSWLKQRDVTWL